MPTKNLWSLNIDELLVADKLKNFFKKGEYEVFFPLNSQMKGIDLILLNLKNNKVITLQVKGSRTWDPKKSEVKRYGEGSAAWFRLDKNSVFKSKNKIDFYILALHCFHDADHKKEIVINYLIIPTRQFRIICSKKTLRKGGYYHFFIWIDCKNSRTFDFNNSANRVIPLSKYLNNWKLIK
ncbi:MAG: hypothetical protein ACD_26C00145G0004 [uncultured bacterium]|nr:MAG: hypothetical protein ACD_26C00145G0004 [uncultured bacterium]